MNFIKNFLIIILFSIFVLLFQTEIVKPYFPIAFMPNLFVICVIFLSFNDVSFAGVLFTFIIGLILDISSGELLGPWAASFVFLYTSLIMFTGRIFIDSVVSLFLLTIVASIICDAIYILLIYTFMPKFENTLFFMLSGSLVTAIFSPFIMMIFKKYYIIGKDR